MYLLLKSRQYIKHKRHNIQLKGLKSVHLLQTLKITQNYFRQLVQIPPQILKGTTQTDKELSLWCGDAALGSESDKGVRSEHLQCCTLCICGIVPSPSVQSPARWQTCG